jgi:hypothetical protein
MVDVNNSDGIDRTRTQVVIADLDDDEKGLHSVNTLGGRHIDGLDDDEKSSVHIVKGTAGNPNVTVVN